MRNWIDVCVGTSDFTRVTDEEGNSTFALRCPDLYQGAPCPAMMRPVNVEIAATKASYATFARLARRHIAESTPGWRWCLAPNCDNGQVHKKEDTETELPSSSPEKKVSRKRGKKKAAATEAANEGGKSALRVLGHMTAL